MITISLRAIVCSFTLCSLVSPGHAVTYTATLLQPLGAVNSEGHGISGTTQVGSASGPATGGTVHAFLWNGSAASAVDLNPLGFDFSYAEAADGSTQVGHGGNSVVGASHALMWNGTAGSAIDLNPPRFPNSAAVGVSGLSEVGYGWDPAVGDSSTHALLWNGTAASALDLNPAAFGSSYANAVSGASQVGYGSGPLFNISHALLWHDTAASAIDLHPAGFFSSYAYGVSGGSQVGYGTLDVPTGEGDAHALLWTGSAASVLDLQPAGFDSSSALGVSGAGQVGWAMGTGTDYRSHAIYWSGTAASAVDLDGFLSGLGPTFTGSLATGISDTGSIVGYASDARGNTYAVLWTPVPEPATLVLLMFAAAGGCLRRSRAASPVPKHVDA
jgi:probable HAF family extracellular repeat protein